MFSIYTATINCTGFVFNVEISLVSKNHIMKALKTNTFILTTLDDSEQ